MNPKTKRLINEHLKKAREKHPLFVAGIMHVPAIATEELGEMVKEINNAYYECSTRSRQPIIKKAKDEALDLIAVLIRFIEDD